MSSSKFKMFVIKLASEKLEETKLKLNFCRKKIIKNLESDCPGSFVVSNVNLEKRQELLEEYSSLKHLCDIAFYDFERLIESDD